MPEMAGWSNPSVLAFADGQDPLESASKAARDLLRAASARGLAAPPVDPLALAGLLGLGTSPRDDVADASIAEDWRDVDARGSGDAPLREFVQTDTPLLIAYNPNRPKGRLRFSIAHEVAHALFPGVADVVRHRTPAGALPDVSESDDEYELELLCNIVAGELLLPDKAVAGLLDIDTDVDFIMETRRKWDVSTEALLRRLVMSSRRELTLVAASRVTSRDSAPLKIDYVVGPASAAGAPASTSRPPLQRGQRLDPASPFSRCTAVGQTARGTISIDDKEWSAQTVGIPGYPGQLFPRVLGLVEPVGGPANPRIRHVQSDLLDFGEDHGPVTVAHVVNDSAHAWSRRGVAAALAAQWPQAAQAFRAWTIASPENLRLGKIHVCEQRDGDRVVNIVSMVAQQGFGPGAVTRLHYDALHDTLAAVADLAQRTGATVHVPRIGAGQAGGRWDLIENDLAAVIADKGIGLVVHTLPSPCSHVGTAHVISGRTGRDSTRIVVLSGPVGAGKTTLGRALEASYGAVYVRTQDLLRDHAEENGVGLPAARRALQDYGDRLDRETGGAWVAEAVSARAAELRRLPELLIVDSVRRLSQITALRAAFPRVDHIHVFAPESVLDERYQSRGDSSGLAELASYAEVARNETESEVHSLAKDADVAIDTTHCDRGDVEIRAAAALRLLPPKRADGRCDRRRPIRQRRKRQHRLLPRP